MKRIFALLFSVLMLFSFVRVANNKQPLYLNTFASTLSTFSFDAKPFLTAFENVQQYATDNKPDDFPDPFQGFKEAEDILDVVTAFGSMFSALGKCLVLICEWLIYLVSVLIQGIIQPLWAIIVLVFTTIVKLVKMLLFFFGFIPSVA